jgi:hypothetical protein
VIRTQFGQRGLDGTVVSLKNSVLVVALEKGLSPKLPRVWLIADDSSLIQGLKDRLGAVQTGEAQAAQHGDGSDIETRRQIDCLRSW